MGKERQLNHGPAASFSKFSASVAVSGTGSQRRMIRVAGICVLLLGGHGGSTSCAAPLLGTSLSVLNADGNPVTSVALNEPFLMQTSVSDLRGEPMGVFSAYVDVAYDRAVVRVEGVTFGDEFPNRHRVDLSQAGRIEETGGISDLDPNGAGPHLLFEARMVPQRVGLLGLSLDPPELQGNELLLYDLDRLVLSSETVFDGMTLLVRESYCDFDINGVVNLNDLYGPNAYAVDQTRCLAELHRLPADANGDGQVQFADFVILANHFGQPGLFPEGDFDFDRQVQFSDFVILAVNFGRSSAVAGSRPAGGNPVPEPGANFYSWLLLLAIRANRRR